MLFMTQSMKEINVIFRLYLPQPKFVIKVREDNQSCIAMAQNPKFSPWTKHIALKYHHFLQACYYPIKSKWIPQHWVLLHRWTDCWHIYQTCLGWYLLQATWPATKLVARTKDMRECEYSWWLWVLVGKSMLKTSRVFSSSLAKS
jgi:hypothetical protein